MAFAIELDGRLRHHQHFRWLGVHKGDIDELVRDQDAFRIVEGRPQLDSVAAFLDGCVNIRDLSIRTIGSAVGER